MFRENRTKIEQPCRYRQLSLQIASGGLGHCIEVKSSLIQQSTYQFIRVRDATDLIYINGIDQLSTNLNPSD